MAICRLCGTTESQLGQGQLQNPLLYTAVMAFSSMPLTSKVREKGTIPPLPADVVPLSSF